jgi:flagellar motor switch protein FliN/FliY
MDTNTKEPTTATAGAAAPKTVEPAKFDELTDSGSRASADEVDLAVILDVPVTLALEVGRTKMTIRDLLRLNQGSVVELDRSADEPMDLLVNGTLVAKAEIVIVEEMFGIRLIDVVSPSERIKNLRVGNASK